MEPNVIDCCFDPAEDSGRAFDDYHTTLIQGIFGNYMLNSPYKLGYNLNKKLKYHLFKTF